MRILLLLSFGCAAAAQVCRLSVAGLNRERKVSGDIAAECPGNPLHSAPFGNWGATSNFGVKRDSHQFDGWCHDSRVCDSNGNCRTDCRDGWYEWNSCTTHSLYKPPNCTLYNSDGCTTQTSTQGVNVHGTQTVEIPVRCPIDTNNDGIADAGGCSDVKNYSHGTNFLSLYELDVTGDELIQTVYFPATTVNLNCTPGGCPAAGSEWMRPVRWDSPAEPAKVTAEMAMVVNSGTFVDSGRACRALVTVANSVSAASFQPAVAPSSIVSAFGVGLTAGSTASAPQPPPSVLAGSRVFVTDSAGSRRAAPLLYASPGQINYVTPPETASGEAVVTVEGDAGIRATGSVRVDKTAPAIFTSSGSGSGRPAALVLRRDSAGNDTYSFAADPVDLAGAADAVLLLFATGIRHAASIEVRIGGISTEVLFAGPQPEFAGLDQVNARIPAALRGRGEAAVELSADGIAANAVSISLR